MLKLITLYMYSRSSVNWPHLPSISHVLQAGGRVGDGAPQTRGTATAGETGQKQNGGGSHHSAIAVRGSTGRAGKIAGNQGYWEDGGGLW